MIHKNACKLIVAAFVISLAACAEKISMSGDQVNVKVKDHALVLKNDSSLDKTCMIFGLQLGEEIEPAPYYEASLHYINMDDVEWLKRQYPDFYRCESAGAKLAESQVKSATLIAANDGVKKKIEELRKLYGASKNRIVLKMKGYHLTLQKHQIKDMVVEHAGSNPDRLTHFLLDDIEYEETTT